MATTKIEWSDVVWNPVTGCTKISPGCKHCYAERMALRLQAMGQPHYVNGFKVALHPDALEMPLRWRKPRRVFVNSMSDLFHPDVPDEFVREIWDIMKLVKRHTYLILTKRPDRMLAYFQKQHDDPLPNLWLGTSVESADYLRRIEFLWMTPAALRFLSLEPLLGPLPGLDLTGIDWVIVGGESGPGARPMEASWVREIRDLCLASGTPFFFKQWGGVRKERAGRLLDGREWNETP